MSGAAHLDANLNCRDNVALVGTGRTGSSLVWSLCRALPDIVLTDPKEFLRFRPVDDLKAIVRLHPSSIVFTHLKISPGHWNGSRFVLNDGTVANQVRITPQEAIALLKESHFSKFVHIRRINHVRHYLSVQRAWGTEGADRRLKFRRGWLSRPRKHPIRVDPGALVDWVDRCEMLNSAIANAMEGEVSIDLTYETDLMDDYRPGIDKLMSFSGVSSHGQLRSELKRTNPFAVQEVVSNYDELVEAVGDYEWKWMLEE